MEKRLHFVQQFSESAVLEFDVMNPFVCRIVGKQGARRTVVVNST